MRAPYAVMLALAAAATRAGAQLPPQLDPPSPLPPPLSIVWDSAGGVLERPSGALMRAGSAVYDMASTRAGQVTPLGTRTVVVSESASGSAPAWLIAEARTGTPLETTDSLYLDRSDLSPVRWVATSGRAMLAASFTRDSLYGAMQSYQGRSSFTAPLAPDALVTPGMVERIVELLPLALDYRARATVMLVELGAPRSVAAELAVEREESVTLPVGTVECWVVTLSAAPSAQTFWVSKASPRVVKSEQVVGGATLTSLLRP